MAVAPKPGGKGLTYLDEPPLKEYTVHDCCYPFLSGGGYQKIRLFEDDISFEQNCPCPWPILCIPIPGLCIFSYIACSSAITRKPYKEIKGVQLDSGLGCCCERGAPPSDRKQMHPVPRDRRVATLQDVRLTRAFALASATPPRAVRSLLHRGALRR